MNIAVSRKFSVDIANCGHCHSDTIFFNLSEHWHIAKYEAKITVVSQE